MRSWLFIVARNFGDALFHRRLIDAVAASFPEDRLDLLTRPQFKGFFAGRPGVRTIHTAAFPVGTMKEFGVAASCHLFRVVMRLRREKYDIAVNMFGDLRETLLGKLIAPHENVAPVWPATHPFTQFVRPQGASWLTDKALLISPEVLNVYDANWQMALQLGCPEEVVFRLQREQPARREFQGKLIGLHPFASQECKLWTWSAWSALIDLLLSRDLRVRVFCSAKEQAVVQANLSSALANPGVQLIMGDLDTFLRRLREVALVVGLDSFAMHAAYALGVPVVLVNGANDARVFAPPGARILSNGGNCSRHPCHSQPTCGDGVVPLYTCIHGVSAERVFDEVRAALADLGTFKEADR